MVRGQKETLFYTGDVCFHDQTILRKARFEDVKADVLIMETTRGNRALPPGFTREGEIERLSQSIRESAASGASGIVKRLIDDLRNFVGAQPQNDDITVIAIRKT